MALEELASWLDILIGGVALLASLGASLWAYSKFIVERGLIPPVQFDIECAFLGQQDGREVIEALIHLKNLGTATLIATDIRLDVRYLDSSDEARLFTDGRKYGQLDFPRSLQNELLSDRPEASRRKTGRGLRIIPHDTFVQPGVDQTYSFITTIPAATSYLLLWSSFQYAQRPSILQRIILFLSRRLGLIQFSLTHINVPHTVARTFKVPAQNKVDIN